MRVTRRVTVGDIEVEVKELTLAEIRAWLKESESTPGNLVDATLFEEFDAQDLRAMSSITAEQLEGLTPSGCRALAGVCREVNADFFAMRQRVVAMGQQLLSPPLNRPSPV